MSYQRGLWNLRICTPAPSISRMKSSSTLALPTQSSSTCTFTPARARSDSASAKGAADVARPVDVGLEFSPLLRLSTSKVAASVRTKVQATALSVPLWGRTSGHDVRCLVDQSISCVLIA
jgi:hypothetical protein